MQYGLTELTEDLKDYILGSSKMPFIPYREDGNWEDALPKYENQTTRLGQETSACTAHGSLNQIETFIKGVYGIEPNYSERFTYNLVPIDPKKGTDPQKTHECIRANGVVDEKYLPMTDSIEEYLDKSDITGSLLAQGQNWLLNHDYRHEWLWTNGSRPTNYIEILKEALKTSPIAVSVTAWREVNGVYVSGNGGNNHYCLLYKIDEEGYPWIFDSYDHSKKKLAKDHNIRRAKRIWVNRLVKKSMRTHISVLQKIVNLLMQKETLLDVCNRSLNTDVTPQDEVKDEVACASTVTTLLKKVYPEIPHITGTWTLNEFLKNSPNWKIVNEYEPECVVIAPTGTGRMNTVGHTGIVMDDGTIASNNSFGLNAGKFTKNYTPQIWEKKYVDFQKMQNFIYKRV